RTGEDAHAALLEGGGAGRLGGGEDPDRRCPGRPHERASRGRAQSRIEDDTVEGPARPRLRPEARIVREDGPHPDRDPIVETPQRPRATALARVRDPFRLAG